MAKGPGVEVQERSSGGTSPTETDISGHCSSDLRSSTTGSAICDLVSFDDGSEELLRGVRLAKVMRGCGSIFRNSQGSASTYDLSETVDSITYFISHNWAISRVAKYLSLAFKFNVHFAMAVGFLTMAFGCVLGIAGVLPTMHAEGEEYRMGYLTRILIVPSIMLPLLFGGDLLCWHLPSANPVMFLDKACIHQVDKKLQKAGIRKLGAFLRASDKMLVLLTPLYLKKLWTVYEVASFFSVHDLSNLEVLPVMLPIAFVVFVTAMYVFQFFTLAVHAFGVPSVIHWSVNFIGAFIYLMSLRSWARSKVGIQNSIGNFSVHKAHCAVESDRAIVYQNITALQKACGEVQRNAKMEDALQVFDSKVRTSLSLYFKDVFGRLSFTEAEYFIIGIVATGGIHMDHWAKVGDGQPIREALGERSMDFWFEFFAIPLWAITLEVLAGCYLSPAWLSWKDLAFALVANAFASCIGNGLMVVQHWWGEKAKHDDYWLAGAVIVSVVCISLRVYVIRRYGSLHRAGWTGPTFYSSEDKSLSDSTTSPSGSGGGESGPSGSSTNASLDLVVDPAVDPTVEIDCIVGGSGWKSHELVPEVVIACDV